MTEKPNVLFIICDDLNNAIEGMGRKPFAPAPNIVKLIKNGVAFTNAHSNCPICLPARNMLLSGLYAHNTGHYTLWDSWKEQTHICATGEYQRPYKADRLLGEAVMMPCHFKDNGYGVYGAGKVHHEGKVSDEWWDEYKYGPDYGPAVKDKETGEDKRHPIHEFLYNDEPLESYLKRYDGLDRFFARGGDFGPHIEMAFGPMDEIFKPEAGRFEYGRGGEFRYVNDDDRDPLPDEMVAEYAADVLSREHDKPFFLAAGFMKPHSPWNAPRKYHEMFPLEEIELPPILNKDTDDCATALVENMPYGFLVYDMVLKGGEKMYRKWVQSYLAAIAFMDEQVGKVLDALEQSPYKDNTVIVFTSDNGYHMGEKEYIFKNSLWEEGGQIPLVISGAGVSENGKECTKPVSLIDLYPTLIDLCGLSENPHESTHGHPLQGHSLKPFLKDPENGQWEGPDFALMSVRGNTGIHHSVRSEKYRYTLCGNGEEELYDHEKDPHEWTNICNDAEYTEIKKELREKLLKTVFES